MNKKVIVFGGGTGLSCLLKGLKQFPVDITAVVSVCDDGGSTGILRDEFDILAVGDIRKVLVALSQTESSVEELLNHRFNTNGTLNKHTVGNILLTAATEMTGSIQQGIELLGKVLNLCGNVMPVTESNITLSAEMMDGSVVDGEHFITTSSKKIKRVFYKETPEINDSLLKEIKSADLIAFSMGSLYTSILPCLLSKEIINKLDKSSAPIVYACNLFTQPGETDKFKVSDHLKIINSYLGKRKIDVVIANNGKIDERLAYKYLSTEQKDPVLIDYDETKKNVKKIIEDNLITIENGVFRHDTLKLGYLLFSEVLRLKKNKRKKKY
ncbi:MAG: YvcK family protein [Clostridium sp.]|nr:YvcK family protein [Clostridium sp.]